jgi:hypothetical protein
LLNAKACEEISGDVAYLMAKELGFDKKWQIDQVETFNEMVKNYMLIK